MSRSKRASAKFIPSCPPVSTVLRKARTTNSLLFPMAISIVTLVSIECNPVILSHVYPLAGSVPGNIEKKDFSSTERPTSNHIHTNAQQQGMHVMKTMEHNGSCIQTWSLCGLWTASSSLGIVVAMTSAIQKQFKYKVAEGKFRRRGGGSGQGSLAACLAGGRACSSPCSVITEEDDVKRKTDGSNAWRCIHSWLCLRTAFGQWTRSE